MITNRTIAVSVLVWLMLLFGCTTTTQQKLDGAEAMSSAAIDSVLDAHSEGVISDDKLLDLEEKLVPAATALQQARTIVDTKPETAEEYIRSARIVLGAVQSLLSDFGVLTNEHDSTSGLQSPRPSPPSQ